MKYFCRSKYNHVKSGVLKKHIYLALQYDELLAVSVQIYRISMSESQKQLKLKCLGKNSFQIASVLPLN